jgi:hypothetical protein
MTTSGFISAFPHWTVRHSSRQHCRLILCSHKCAYRMPDHFFTSFTRLLSASHLPSSPLLLNILASSMPAAFVSYPLTTALDSKLLQEARKKACNTCATCWVCHHEPSIESIHSTKHCLSACRTSNHCNLLSPLPHKRLAGSARRSLMMVASLSKWNNHVSFINV